MSKPSSSSSPQTAMQETPSTTITVVETVDADEQDHQVPVLKLRLKKPKTGQKVQWSTETVDNEHMNKKKSKCCCIYEKPRVFGEDSDSDSSGDDDDDECQHCKGHVEKKKHHHNHQHDEESPEEMHASKPEDSHNTP